VVSQVLNSLQVSSGRSRTIKKKALGLLTARDWPRHVADILQLPGNQVVNPLISFLMHRDELVRWRAVISLGLVVAGLAEEHLERARVIMRRFMWSLNDESGGIGWGAPESMAEIMVRSEVLAREYSSVFVSYLNPDGNFLEYELLQRGLLWGVVRLAQLRPAKISGAAPYLVTYLESSDPFVRGLAARAVGLLRARYLREKTAALLEDDSELRIFGDSGFQEYRVKELAREALAALDED